MGDSISEGTVAKWHKAVGDSVKVDDVVVSLETDKVTVDINAKVSGVITERLANEGEVVAVGKQMFKIKKGAVADTPKAAAPKAEAKQEAAPPKAEAPQQKAAPTPTPAPTQTSQPPKHATPAPTPSTTAPVQPGSRDRLVKMTPMRRRIAERLKQSQNTAAMLTTFQECDMSAISDLRSQFQDAFLKKHGVKLGFMSAFVKASVAALQDQPSVNAVIEGDYIRYRDFYDLSVAVATPRGLVVPVIRDCDKKSFADIEKSSVCLVPRQETTKLRLKICSEAHLPFLMVVFMDH
jgi:2-oxoglutarate dehydrogenase E2 component (dihydrolipoamide succinyltransferase)